MSRDATSNSALGPVALRLCAVFALAAVLLAGAAATVQARDNKPCAGYAAGGRIAPGAAHRATLLFMPGPLRSPAPLLSDYFAQLPGFAVGLFSPTLGRYTPAQMLLDISQGARVASGLYQPSTPPPPTLATATDGAGRLVGWPAIVRRADAVPGEVVPGLLGCAVRHAGGGIAWVAAADDTTTTAIAAAATDGSVQRVQLAEPGRLAAAIAAAQRRQPLVVAALPAGGYGIGVIRRLARADPRRLILVVQTPPDPARTRLLVIAARGIGDGGLRSATTRRDGLVAATDIAPTILGRLGIVAPSVMQGRPIESAPRMTPARLQAMNDRLALIAGRRVPLASGVLLLVAAFLALLLGFAKLTGRFAPVARLSMRVAALAMLWLPLLLLIAGALRPSRALETDLAFAGSMLLAWGVDRFVRWPRAPWVPALASLVAYGADFALLGSKFTGQSLLGPNPHYGARFFGVGNELEILFTVSALLGLGAFLCDRPAVRRPARWFAAAGALLALFLGLGRLGADVGGVVTVGVGFGVAALYVGRLRLTPLRAVALIVIPIAALALIAGLDALTGGQSHLSRTVVHAQSAGELVDVFVRRLRASVESARSVGVWIPALAAIGLLAWGAVRRERLFARLVEGGEDPAARRPYRAALAGGLAATLIGALANDSGPAILIIGTIYLAMGVIYSRGRPPRGPEKGDNGA